ARGRTRRAAGRRPLAAAPRRAVQRRPRRFRRARRTKLTAASLQESVTAVATAESRRSSADVAALLAALVTVLVWASAFVGIRSAGRSFSPGALSLGRLAVAIAALGVLGAVQGERLPSRAQLRAAGLPLLFCGLLWFGAYNVALNAGERRVDAGTAAMLVNIGPILIAVIAGLVLREGFPRALFAGCAIAFGGVAIIAVASSSRSATTTGVLL